MPWFTSKAYEPFCLKCLLEIHTECVERSGEYDLHKHKCSGNHYDCRRGAIISKTTMQWPLILPREITP